MSSTIRPTTESTHSEQAWAGSGLAEASSFLQRVVLVEHFLLRKAASAHAQTSAMQAAMQLFHGKGAQRIERLAGGTGLSQRHFERRFHTDVHLTPKVFARIARFQMALDAKVRRPATPWVSIAHEFEYHDHMHMLRDFRDLGGFSPNHLITQLGDGRPPALAAARLKDESRAIPARGAGDCAPTHGALASS